MKVLVLNSGSSSIKFQLFEMENNESIASGIIEQIGSLNSSVKIKYKQDYEKLSVVEKNIKIDNHKVGLEIMNSLLLELCTLEFSLERPQ